MFCGQERKALSVFRKEVKTRFGLKYEGRTRDCYLADKLERDKIGRSCRTIWEMRKEIFLWKLDDTGSGRRR